MVKNLEQKTQPDLDKIKRETGGGLETMST